MPGWAWPVSSPLLLSCGGFCFWHQHSCANVWDSSLGILISCQSRNPGWCGNHPNASPKNAKLSLTSCIPKHVQITIGTHTVLCKCSGFTTIPIGRHCRNPGWCGINQNESPKNAKLSLTRCIPKHVANFDRHSHCKPLSILCKYSGFTTWNSDR